MTNEERLANKRHTVLRLLARASRLLARGASLNLTPAEWHDVTDDLRGAAKLADELRDEHLRLTDHLLTRRRVTSPKLKR